MIDSKRVLCVIIGRAGSRGLPGKNTLPLAGLPLVAHTIEDARESRLVDRVVVSTDGEQIAAVASSCDVEVVMRPTHLASDTATVDSAVRHVVESLAEDAPIVVILYANVPIRPDDLIDRAIHRLVESGAESVQSYADVGKYHPWWMMQMDAMGRVSPYRENTTYRRQDLPPLMIPDGGVIAVTHDSLFTTSEGHPHAFLGATRYGIATDSGAVVDIDTEHDLHLAEAILAAHSEPVQ